MKLLCWLKDEDERGWWRGVVVAVTLGVLPDGSMPVVEVEVNGGVDGVGSSQKALGKVM